jgi:integral membrane protein
MEKKHAPAVSYLRITGIAEGISFLVLLGIAMPLKYLAGIPELVKFTGWAHGLLLIVYVFCIIWARETVGLSWKHSIFAFVASLFPFGTFYADKKLFRNL